jgi:multiple sugar transport system ATP-binding protein
MSSIRLERLSKRFGAFNAVRDLDLAIADGEFMALLGPSGCGKSTTMNMIAGMEEPTEGRILFGDRDMRGVPPGRRGVGFVFQNYAIFTHMTVRGNLDYGLRVARRPAAEVQRRTEAIAELLGLTALLDQPTAGLSVNILQRIAIGRSAILNPAIFLLDEPLSNVDAAFRAVMRGELKALQRQFRQTMVYVTHDQLEAMTMADRIAVMDHGVLQQVGTPLEIYNQPANVFVAGFIGAPGMNLLPGRLANTDRGLAVDLGAAGLTPPLPPALAAAARARGVQDVIWGFRPETAEIAGEGPALRLPLLLTERIGARMILHFGKGEAVLRAVFPAGTALPEARVLALRPEPHAVRLFDAATGRAIREAV